MLYPDLSEIGVRTALDGDRPALRLSSAHPYCRGFAADGQAVAGDVVPLDQGAGEHELVLAAVTDYGVLAGHVMKFQVSG